MMPVVFCPPFLTLASSFWLVFAVTLVHGQGDASANPSLGKCLPGAPAAGTSTLPDKGVALCLTGLVAALGHTAPLISKNLLPSLEEDGLRADVFLYAQTPKTSDFVALGTIKESAGLQFDAIRFDNEDDLAKYVLSDHSALRAARELRGTWLGHNPIEVVDGKHRAGSGLLLMYGHQMCLEMMLDREARRGRRYSRVVNSRTDIKWIHPHPSLSVLRNDQAWVPDTLSDDYCGVYDRHFVLPRDAADHVLGAWNLILSGCAVFLWEYVHGQAKLLEHRKSNLTYNPEMWLLVRLLSAPGSKDDGRLEINRYPMTGYVSCKPGASVRAFDLLKGYIGPIVCTKEADHRYALEHRASNFFAECLKAFGGWEENTSSYCTVRQVSRRGCESPSLLTRWHLQWTAPAFPRV